MTAQQEWLIENDGQINLQTARAENAYTRTLKEMPMDQGTRWKGSQASKLAAALVEHIHVIPRMFSKADAQWVIKNPERALMLFGRAAFQRHSPYELAIPGMPRTLKVWKTAMTGNIEKGYSKDNFHQSGQQVECYINEFANDLIISDRFERSPKKLVYFVLLTKENLEAFHTSSIQPTDLASPEFCKQWSAKYLDGYVIEPCHMDDALEIFIQHGGKLRGAEDDWSELSFLHKGLATNDVFFLLSEQRIDDRFSRCDLETHSVSKSSEIGERLVYRYRKMERLELEMMD